ncbi:hypothetical protein J6590_087814 [Homalodisca vitripennis]|nr:hypothetical protein J6590_087814 [Homalodisca vitripennis]
MNTAIMTGLILETAITLRDCKKTAQNFMGRMDIAYKRCKVRYVCSEHICLTLLHSQQHVRRRASITTCLHQPTWTICVLACHQEHVSVIFSERGFSSQTCF